MKKQTKVLLAAALFTLGASFSAMAAIKNGEWKVEDGQYVYYDRDGEVVYEEWCDSLGIEYWMNEDGVLGSSEWVDDEDRDFRYYVQSDGSKTKNAWKYLYENEDAEEENWFWFDEKGRMRTNDEEEINGKTYYFGDDGKMLTGWVYYDSKNDEVRPAVKGDPIANIRYCNEDGARESELWLEDFGWGEDADELYEEDLNWYYITSAGKVQTGKNADIEGHTYFFNKDTGILITGWVEKYEYTTDKYAYTACNAVDADTLELYWTDETGYAKKNQWLELECPEDNDNDYWYHFDAKGRAFLPLGASDTDAYAGTFTSGEDYDLTFAETASKYESKKIDGVKYYFNQKGELLTGLQKIGGEIFNLVDGVKATGLTSVTDKDDETFTFYFAPKKDETYSEGAAVTGNVDGYLYENGQLVTSEDSDVYKKEVVTIDGKDFTFIVDYTGKIQKSTTKKYDLGKVEVEVDSYVKTKGYSKHAVTLK